MLVKVWEKVYARLDLVRNHELAQSLSNLFFGSSWLSHSGWSLKVILQRVVPVEA